MLEFYQGGSDTQMVPCLVLITAKVKNKYSSENIAEWLLNIACSYTWESRSITRSSREDTAGTGVMASNQQV